jgi:hypothetical protein
MSLLWLACALRLGARQSRHLFRHLRASKILVRPRVLVRPHRPRVAAAAHTTTATTLLTHRVMSFNVRTSGMDAKDGDNCWDNR